MRRLSLLGNIKAKLFGIGLIAFGIVLIITYSTHFILVEIGIAAIIIGIFAFIVITEQTVPQKLAEAQLRSQLELIYNFIRNLNLRGNGVYLPAVAPYLRTERIYVPLLPLSLKSNNPKKQPSLLLPASLPTSLELDDATVFLVGGTKSQAIGTVFTPPGLYLLNYAETKLGFKLKGMGIAELERNLQYLIYELRLITDLKIELVEQQNIVNVKFRHSGYAELCNELRTNLPELCTKVQCPICSVIATAITRAIGQRLIINSTEYTPEDRLVEIKFQIIKS